MKLSRYKIRAFARGKGPLAGLQAAEAELILPQCSKRYSRTSACISSSRSILQIMLLALP